MARLKAILETEIKRQITDHLVRHVLRPGDTRDRVNILTDELSDSIVKILKRKRTLKVRKLRKWN